MIPKGFLFSTAEAAIKKPGRRDLALIYSEKAAHAAGAFTTNSVKAAPVRICMEKIKSGKAQAIVVNSGNANACTGRPGMRDARGIVSVLSKSLGLHPHLIYPCSTGVIGTSMPMERILPSLDPLTRNLGKSSLEDVAKAMMTTDTFPKIVHKKIKIGDRYTTISGICKGAGMIAPHMATMLCYILTDAAVEQRTLNGMLKEAVNKSFNRITIDGDMSTNDTVLLLANGLVGNRPITRKSAHFATLKKAVEEICLAMSRLIVKDGEGATKLIEVNVKGARNESDAERAAFSVANSNLVKTAIYGNDANWGRIMCALGYSGIRFDEAKTDISFNKIRVVKGGLTTHRDARAAAVLKSKEITITIDLHAGKANAKVLTCDLTEGYIRINAEYRT